MKTSFVSIAVFIVLTGGAFAENNNNRDSGRLPFVTETSTITLKNAYIAMNKSNKAMSRIVTVHGENESRHGENESGVRPAQ